ncbi:D-alanyl-D-alanine carboxypeptidase/D-alanyl-D-alanine endopeptidase [Oceanobacillus alkalisoli]|uniref:D-alanyl-D-alanine carboxypeptidase/D-alanyl-D-alanine endopeptidase n=1 Tax=Oceanobacillus alkalisoli TaxID=2925113 RepID=UPI001EE430B5|nr:D-alanyl-D-alanine carboxypeptidase/D-alanyl-D-alanine-endopeptidase [Oceanobacillus alkalisoli]MCG5104095.1 D-alanyl-D-alanine carboxypeptidase/D-alanyl-D-alanine-endopeptidase [Oceanobacillus alkalisoli]
MKSKPFLKMMLFFIVIIIVASLPSVFPEEPLFLEASKEDHSMTLAENKTLEEKINSLLENEQLDGAVVGVTVKQAANGDLLYSHNGDIRLHPASNMKLLTGAAALETLGSDYQFQTEILSDGELNGNTLHGNLFIKGKGDPTLLKSDLNQFARELKAQGIETIDGDLVGDDTWYDDVRLSQDLNWSDEPFHTGAQVSALTLSPNEDYDAGTVIVDVMPSESTEGKAQVRVSPETDYVNIVNQTQLVQAGGAQDISIEREHGTNRIIVEGTMPVNGTLSRSWVSVWEPTGYVLAVFRDALAEQGIQFTDESRNMSGATPEQAQVVASKKSIPLSELLIPFMKLSNNGLGEALTKEMGKVMRGTGTWDKGLEVIEDVVTEIGVERESFLLRDGSGMSHKTLISANNITHILYNIQSENWFDVFEYSLPVAGETDRLIGGTLRNRLTKEPAKGNVKAKTGLITGVSTLSGYVTSLDGEKLIFSILLNNHLGSSESIQEIENEIVMVLAGHEFLE